MINGVTGIHLATTSTAYTITAYPGTLVNIELTGSAKRFNSPIGTTTSSLAITTSGVTFNNGSTTTSVTNSGEYVTLVVPASGSVSLNGSYSTTASGAGVIVLAGVSVF